MRTIAVTGTASGLGAATRRRLLGRGDRVIGVDRRDADVVADLSSAPGRDHAVEAVLDASGGRLDGVVSCAGLGPYEPPEPVTRVNYFGAIALLDQLRGALGRGREPAAVAIASVGAAFEQLVDPAVIEACHSGDEERAVALLRGGDGNTAYVTCKRALALAVRRRAAEWGALGIRLNAVAPGKMETPMLAGLLAHEGLGPAVEALPVGLGRTAPPEEIAGAVLFLLDSDASYVHGQVLFVDGGSEAIVRPDQV